MNLALKGEKQNGYQISTDPTYISKIAQICWKLLLICRYKLLVESKSQ